MKCSICNKSKTLFYEEVCEKCFKKHFVKCHACNKYILKLFAYNHGDLYFCGRHCIDNFKHKFCGIIGYYTKPNVVFCNENKSQDYYARKDKLHIGVELEIQGINKLSFCKTLHGLYNNYNTFYLKEDGSLNCYGIEIISQPMTFENVINSNHWKLLFDLIKEYKMNNTNNCGLHFHLDKEYLTDDNIKSLDYIVNTFSEYFEKIGGRPFNDYCNKAYKIMENWGKNTTDRYVAVNLENNNTVELRFCKSTDDYDTFIEKIKFMFKLIEFVKQYSFDYFINNDYDTINSLIENSLD
jgi:hypothetical protein